MLHEILDIEKFKSIFPLARLRDEAREFVRRQHRENPRSQANEADIQGHIRLMEPGGQIVTSPYHLAVVEQLREEAAADFAGVQCMPTDAFVFAEGEPPDRRMTKVGGVPYWPKRLPWPTSPDSQPMQFVAQLCFVDSLSICGQLPGNMLLIFMPPGQPRPDGLQCHWLTADESELVTPQDVPALPLMRAAYGVLDRTFDYVDSPKSLERYNSDYRIAQIEGTKIGGIPRWVQGESDSAIGCRFLCALGSIHPAWGKPYPFVNAPAPVDQFADPKEHTQGPWLMWGDVGSVYFFLDDRGGLRWVDQCY